MIAALGKTTNTTAEVHLETLLQGRMESSPTRSPVVLAALASALGSAGHPRTWELLAQQAVELLPCMGPREMSHLAYAATRRVELRHLLEEIEREATLRLPEFPARSLCHLAFASKQSQLLIAIACEMAERGLDEFQPNEIAQAAQSFAHVREAALTHVEAKICQAADRFQAREWATILWAFHDGRRTQAVDRLLEQLPQDTDFKGWKLLELVCLHDVAGAKPVAKIARDALRSRQPSTLSELAALFRTGVAGPEYAHMFSSLPADDSGLAQLTSYVGDRSAFPQLQDAIDELIVRLAASIRNGSVEEMGVVDLSPNDTRMLLESLDIPHAVYHAEPAVRTTCHLAKRGIDFERIATFSAGSKAADCNLKSCTLQFDRRRDAEFQALAFIMTEHKGSSGTHFRLQVSRSPCMSCVWALWQARRHHDISIAFPD